jgi:hypothetical protein
LKSHTNRVILAQQRLILVMHGLRMRGHGVRRETAVLSGGHETLLL